MTVAMHGDTRVIHGPHVYSELFYSVFSWAREIVLLRAAKYHRGSLPHGVLGVSRLPPLFPILTGFPRMGGVLCRAKRKPGHVGTPPTSMVS
jgi:hypothetical protein